MSFLKYISFSTVYKRLPVLIIYTSIWGEVAGKAIGPLILIEPKYRDDEGLLEHEKTHVKHSYVGLIVIHALLYLLSDRFRYWSELTCYRVQLTFAKPDQLDYMARKFARFIATRYRLGDVTAVKALDDLIE